VVVLDEGSRMPLGIITLHDVVRRMAIEVLRSAGADRHGDDRWSDYRAGGQHAHQASVVMVRRGVRHLVLTEADGSYFNLVSQTDLYTLPGAQSTDLVTSILAARDLPIRWLALAGEIRAWLPVWLPSG
jgi:CBS domain-containing protein